MQANISPASSPKILQGVASAMMQIAFLWILVSGITLIHNFIQLAGPISSTKTGITLVLLTLFLVSICTRGRFAGSLRFLNYVIVAVGFYGLFLLLEGLLAIAADAGIKRALTTLLNIGAFLLLLIVMFLWAGGGEDAKKGLKFILRPYLYASLYMAVTGILVWILVSTNAVDPKKWPVPRDITPAGKTMYMPFYLSQVTGEQEEDFLFFGFRLLRLSGLSKEPAQVALLITPALFLTPILFEGKAFRRRRRLVVGIFLVFLFFMASVTNWIILFALLPLLFLRYRRKSLLFLFLALTLVGSIFLFKGVRERLGVEEYEKNIVRHKLDTRTAKGLTARYINYWNTKEIVGSGLFGTLEQREAEAGRMKVILPRGALSIITEHLLYLVLVLIALRLIMTRQRGALFGFALLYLVAHTQKDPVHVLEFPFYTFILFCVAIGFMIDYPNKARHEPAIPVINH